MKYVAIALLLANVAYFAWAALLRSPPKAPPQITHRHDDSLASLKLVREREASRARDLRRVVDRPIRGSSRNDGVCAAAGPFQDVFEAEARVQQAAALDITAEIHVIDEPTGEVEYRVMIPPANSIEEAFRKLRELKSLGIDSYIITQGDDALGISLGLFSTREAAESLQTQRERQGYVAAIDELPQVERQYWVFDIGGEPTDDRLDTWESLIADAAAGVELAQRPCPGSLDR